MNELKRLYSKKTLFILAALIIINMGLFMLSCAPEREITLTGEALESYIDEYPEFLEKTKENGRNMSVLNMYKSGFAADNIRKTAEIYSKLEDITVKSGDNRGAVLLLQYELTDIFLLAFLLIMAVQLLSERKKGLANLIRSTLKGRGTPYFQRMAVLAFSAIAAGFLLYGGNYVGMLISFGEGGMSRSIQSLPEFMQCPYNITIAQYFMMSLALKITACFMAASAFFIVISLFGTAAAYTIAALLTVAELLLYVLIIPVSAVNVLKYINIFSIIKCIDFLSVCRNLNIFGKAVPALECNIVFLSAGIAIILAVGYIVHGKMYVRSRNIFERVTEKIAGITEKLSFQRTLFGWEAYKLLVKQGGIIFMTAAFILTLTASLKYDYFYPINPTEEKWYNKFHGEITAEAVETGEKNLDRLEDSIEYYQSKIDELLSYGEGKYNPESLNSYMNFLGQSIEDRDGLLPVLENMRDGLVYTERTGNVVYLIKPYAYDLLIQRDEQTRNRASLYILIGIIGAVSGVFAYDRQNNMKSTLLSSYRGRKVLTTAKIGIVLIVCVITCVSLHLIQFIQIGRLLGYNDISVPVQSLMFMRDFKPYISISEYLFLLFAVRAAAACLVGLVCTSVSRLCTDTMSAMGISIFTLAIPSVFAEIIPNGEFVSAVYIIGAEYFK